MNQWHRDDDVDRAYLKLMDAICAWERATGRNVTILMMPHADDEPIQVSHGGKPVPGLSVADVCNAFDAVMGEREQSRVRMGMRTRWEISRETGADQGLDARLMIEVLLDIRELLQALGLRVTLGTTEDSEE